MWFTTAFLLLDSNTRVTDRATDSWSNYPLPSHNNALYTFMG